ERQEDRIARRHIGDWNPGRELRRGAIFRDRDLVRERGAAEPTQIEFKDLVPTHVERPGDAAGGRDLDLVTLAVAERERIDLKPLLLGRGQGRARVDPAAQQCDGFRLGIGHLSESYAPGSIGTVTREGSCNEHTTTAAAPHGTAP